MSTVRLQDPANEPEPRPDPVTTDERRPFGLAAGEFVVPDDFDDPLPDDIRRGFEGDVIDANEPSDP